MSAKWREIGNLETDATLFPEWSRISGYSAIEPATTCPTVPQVSKLWPMLRHVSGRFTLLAQYALDNLRRKAPIRDCIGAEDWEVGAVATDGVEGRSEYNSTDSAGANGIGTHETGFGVGVKRASRQVERLQNLAGPTNGFHLSVLGNI